MRKRNQRAHQRDQRRQTKAARAQRRAEAARAQRDARAAETIQTRRHAEAVEQLPRVTEERAGRGRPEGPITGLTARFTDQGYDVTSTPIAEEDLDAWRTYLDAHMLLPGDYHLGGPMAEAVAQEAFDLLGQENAPEIAWLRSIVVLGHTPTATALQALNLHATSGQPLADVARMAANECTEWIGHEAGPGTATDMVN